MKKQRGQAIVEFALVLPLFLIFIFGIVLSGMLFADYMTLSNVARSSAREAALTSDPENRGIGEKYKTETRLFTDLYTWDSTVITKNKYSNLNNSVTVTIRTTLNANFPGVSFMKFFTGDKFPPSKYDIDYTMHSEVQASSSNSDGTTQ